jgi:hypothetical protein
MHPSTPIPATTDGFAFYQAQPDSGELLAWFDTIAEPHQPGDEFRYARR